MELVSIIMPCYNMERYIAASIRSVQAQTYPHWELLIIDDGSTDSSMQMINSYADIDSRIKPIQLINNGGIANARNQGIANAEGRYIAFLDSDDTWMAEKLEKQLTFMQQNNISFSYSSFMRVTENGEIVNTKIVPAEISYEDLLRRNFIGCLTAMIDRTKVENLSMPLVKHEDYATWLRILREYKISAYGLTEPLSKYNLRQGSVSSNKFKSMSWIFSIYRNQEKLGFLRSCYNILCWSFIK